MSDAPRADVIILHGRQSSVVIEPAPGAAPTWRYWGPRLPDGVDPGAALGRTRPAASFTLDQDPPLSVLPTFGVGWFAQSALLAHRQGRDFAQAFTDCAITLIRPGQAVRLDLTDDVARLTVSLTLDLDPASDVLTASSTLTNLGETDLEVGWLAAATLPLPSHATRVRSFSGRHNNEFQAQDEPLGRGQWRRENRRGLTSHDSFPGAVVTTTASGADQGLTYGAQLAWSGNHVQSLEWLDDGRWQWQMGEWLAPGEIRLAPGQSLTSPDLLATCSTTGWNGVAQNFHAAIRARMTWPGGAMRPRPVSLNTWEGFYFDHQIEALKALADAAAAVGIERFVLDDGWFHRRRDDRAALGDWRPDADKYPQGLAPLARHVTDLGLEFGLWIEPEMVNPDSDLHRAHPDWALQIAGRPLLTARNQVVLDLSRPEVSDYLFDVIAAQLSQLPIRYLKWDHNRDLTTAGGPDGRARYHSQVLAAYALMARFRAAFPEVEIEACAGGGGRIDAGVLRHTHRVWTSDCIDAVSRVAIQRGFLQFFPPEIMGAHVGAAPAHSTGRSQSMRFRAGVALPGHLGVELDLRQIGDGDRAVLARWIDLYKTWRGRLHTGRVWRGEAGDGLVWQAHGESEDLLLLVYRLDPTGLRYPPPLRLPMALGDRAYRITRIDPPGRQPPPADSLFAEMRAEGAVLSGAWLAEAGLPLPALKAEACVLFRICAP